MDFPNSEFWNYSTQAWTLPDVESVCLELQNTCEININILLYCCWAGDGRHCINEDDLQVLLDTCQPWQTIIQPLRDSRNMMKQHILALSANLQDQTIKNITEMELNAEHMAQISMEKALKLEKLKSGSDLSSVECSLANLKIYFNSCDNSGNSTGDNSDNSSGDCSCSTADILPLAGQLLTALFQDEESVQIALMSQA